MKKLLPLVPFVFLAAGCSSSGADVPIEQVQKSSTATNDPAKNPVQGNPNIPQAAKDAMAGKQ